MSERHLPRTQAFLHAHGLFVEPETLERLTREALERLPRGLYREEPARDLTSAEAEALRQGGFDLSSEDLGEADPLARTAAEYAALLEGSLTAAQAAKRLGVAASRIRQRLSAQPPTLYGVRLSSGWRIPEFQFDGERLLPGVEKVIAALPPDLHPIAVYRWWTTPSSDLVFGEQQVSPQDWLKLGQDLAAVAELAGNL